MLAATDPANPYGATLPGRRDDESPSLRPASRAHALGRQACARAGRYVVNLDAEPVLYVERGGKGLLPLRGRTRLGCGPRSRRSPKP